MLYLRKTACSLLFMIAVKGYTQQTCPPANLGTKTLYPSSVDSPTPPPPGYQPVFINYVSRHGARHLTKPVNRSFAWSILDKADSSGSLTAKGSMLFSLLKKLEAVEKDNVKNISEEGRQEQQEIADRMVAQHTNLFKMPVRNWKAEVTKEIRTRQTAAAFIAALQQQLGRSDSVSYTVNDTTLRFFDLSPAYLQFEESGNWKKSLLRLKKNIQWNAVIRQTTDHWFTPAFAKNITIADAEILVTDVYSFYTILPSLQQEATERKIAIHADSIGQFFSCAALAKLSQADIAEDYLSKGPGTSVTGIQVKIAAPLLADFISTTDAFVQTASEPLQLRFCHAETIAPFTALLGLNEADKAVTTISTFSTKVWNAAAVVPLSANVQWVLYKSDTGNHYLLKCLLNERETSINGLATKQFPYYEWKDVRAFYLKKLLRLKMNLADNGYRYLQRVK